jgi:type II secretory pathway pseudopilin PulG
VIINLRHRHIKGFTLVEAIVGLVMFGAALGGLLPLIMVSRTLALQSDSRVGAIAVAQQVMDSLRQIDVTCIPSTGTNVTKLPDRACPTTPTSTGDSIASLPYKGKTYSATVTYCANSSTYCDTTTRLIRVRVFQDGNTADVPARPATATPIYQLETIYARLQ